MSFRNIAKECGCSRGSVENICRKNNWTRPVAEWRINNANARNVNIVGKELETINGILLGDGSMKCTAITSSLTYGCEFKETLIDIQNDLPSLEFGNISIDQGGCFHFASMFYVSLEKIRKRWYPNYGDKIFPKDVKLTPLCCYWWFVGDGFCRQRGGEMGLCTECFDKDSLDYLLSELTSLGFNVGTYKHKPTDEGLRIRIKAASIDAFLDYCCSDHKIVDQYAYKWVYSKPGYASKEGRKEYYERQLLRAN